MPRRHREEPQEPARPVDPRPQVDLNQVVAFNVRAARELRGWTQEEFAERLERYLGTRLTQASVSAIERAWDGDRRREFDAHELLIFAMVFDLPMIWFLLPPKGDHRLMRGTTRQVDELYLWLLGRPDKLEPLYDRLREYGTEEGLEVRDLVVHRRPPSERRRPATASEAPRVPDQGRGAGGARRVAGQRPAGNLRSPRPAILRGVPHRRLVARHPGDG